MRNTRDIVIRAARTHTEFETMIGNAAQVFGVGVGLFRDLKVALPGFRLRDTRLALVQGRIAAGVSVMPRTLCLNGCNIPMGGIADVHTLPEFRGLGLASALLRDAVDYMKSRGLLLSLLFADLHDFYGRFGYEIIPRREFQMPANAPHGRGAQPGVRVRRIAFLESVDILHSLYRRDALENRGVIVRTPKYWAGFPEGHAHRKPFSLVADINGRAAGICVLHAEVKKEHLRIDECHCPGPDADRIAHVLLTAAARHARGAGLDTVRGILPPAHPMTRIMAAHDGFIANNLMGLILDPTTLAAQTGIRTPRGKPFTAAPAFMKQASAPRDGFILWDDDNF